MRDRQNVSNMAHRPTQALSPVRVYTRIKMSNVAEVRMASSETMGTEKLDLFGADFVKSGKEIERLFREQVQRDIAEHLAAGRPVYYGGIGAEANKLFVHMPDGRRFEYRVREDRTREIMREVFE